MQAQSARSTSWLRLLYQRSLSSRAVAQGWNKPPGDRGRDPETASLWAKLVPEPLKGVRWFHGKAADTGVDGSGAPGGTRGFVCPLVAHLLC